MLVSVILFYAILFSAILSLISKRSSTLFCGIIAYSGSAPFDVNKIKSLFLFNASRGTDGCGMYNQGEITKSNGEIYSEILTWDIQPENIFLGHTRKATFASYKEKKHAHPFTYGNIVGVHNGTLTNHYALSTNNHIISSSWDTDSEVLFKLIDIDPTNLKRIKGTASVAYVNITTPNILYCFRKDDARPLWRGRAEEGMYFSSMKESLEFIGCTKVEELKIKTLYTISNGNITCTTKYLDEEVKTTTTVNGRSGAYMDDDEYDNTYTQYHNYMGYSYNRQAPIVNLNPRPMAHALSWVKIRKDDKSCRDNHGRIVVGGYYQIARKVESEAFYASIILYFDENGLELEDNKTTNILYSVDCLEFLQVDKLGLVVFMADGKNIITTGDIGYVSSIEFKKGVEDETAIATYEVLYPFEAAIKADNTKYKWERQYMRMATKEELYDIWKLHKEKTPYKITEFLQKHFPEINTSTAATKTTVMNGSQSNELRIDDVIGKIKSMTDKDANEAYGLIHSYMVDGDNIFEAFRKVMFLMKDVSTTKEEEDIVVDAETPIDNSIVVDTTDKEEDDDYHDVFPDTDIQSLKMTWLEFKDIIDNIATIKRTSETLSSLVSEIYNEGVEMSCETDKDLKANDFESSEMFNILNTASLTADNLDTAITELIETVVYDYYPTYAPKTK
jgi:hypothetical protein